MKSLIKIAVGELGIKEIPGQEHEKRIIDYAKESGFKGISDDETPWCSIFVNWCCNEAGLQRTNRANARSWLSVGAPVLKPKLGDIVVLWRVKPSSWKGHVGFFIKETERYVYILGGNQNNRVCIKPYAKSRVLDYKRLKRITH